MSSRDPSGLTDELWRASLTVLMAAVAVFIAWQLIEQFIGPLIVIVMLLGIIRLAFGVRSRRGW